MIALDKPKKQWLLLDVGGMHTFGRLESVKLSSNSSSDFLLLYMIVGTVDTICKRMYYCGY